MGRGWRRRAVLLGLFLACLVAFIATQREGTPTVVARDAEVEPDAEIPPEAEVAEDAEVPPDAAPRVPVTDASTFRYVEDERPGSLVPFFAERAAQLRVGELLFDGLLRVGKRGDLEGRLATRWSLDPDRRGIRFTLRRGVKWHDGRPFTAEDVVFTVAAAQDPGTVFAAKGKFTFIRVVEIEDTEHVHVVFKRAIPSPERRFDFKILPAHAFESPAISPNVRFGRGPIGTGPYRLTENYRIRRFTLDANPDYWEPVHIARVVMEHHPLKSEQIRLLQADGSGRHFDLVPWLPPKNIPLFEGSTTTVLEPFHTGEWWFVAFNHAHPALAVRAVRQALSLALDRFGLMEAHLGPGEQMTGPFTEASPFYNFTVPPPRLEIARANALLDAAGWVRDAAGRHKGPVRLDFELTVDKWRPAGVALFEGMRRAWEELGVTLRPKFVEAAQFNNEVRREKTFDLALSAWRFDTLEDVSPLFHSRGGLNFTNFRSRAIDGTLDGASKTTDDRAYKEHMKRLHAQLAEELPYLFLFTVTMYSGLSTRIRNAYLMPHTYFTTFPEWTLAP